MSRDTAMGGVRRSFPTTLWSSILRGTAEDPAMRRAALEKLFRLYWKPVYCCVRFGWNAAEEEAKDVVQNFFVDLLERDFLRDIDPSKGRFRSFIRGALKNFMLNAKRDAARLKRGGGAAIVPLEGIEDVRAAPGEPDGVFDAEWMKTVVERSIATVRAELEAAGKGKYFEVFRLKDLDEGDRSYQQIAKEIGLSESDVRNYLHHARQVFRKIMIRQVSEYALDEQDAEEELRWILG
jgi:RNA polymerase sigma-70 factor (ECF subfamily)